MNFRAQAQVGVIKLSRVNEVINMALPGLDIYYAGVDKDPETGEFKIFIAGRMKDV
jgi:hypothetical protein